MRRHQHALVIGKFYPPHIGHELLVRTAAARARRVTVVVMASRVESIPLSDRVRWLRQVHADDPAVAVVGIPCDVPLDFESTSVWAAQVALMRAAVAQITGEPVDAVVTSEKYGDELAARFRAVHVCVDPDRIRAPVSGRTCRADLAGLWGSLPAPVRAGLAVRVVVVGAESTGTTTVSRALAERFRVRGGVWEGTRWVAEYGREHMVAKLAAAAGAASPDDLVWTAEDFRLIAEEQTHREERAAAEGSPLLVCDTDAWTTSVWERRYLGPVSLGSARAATVDLPRRDVHLLTDHVGVPFVQDGLRDGEHLRAEMTGWFSEGLTRAGHSWVLLTGTHEERVALAVRVADQLLAARATFADPLG